MDDANIELDGKLYHLKFSIGRLEMIEQSIKKPLMAAMQEGNGMLSIHDLKTAFAMALIEDGANAYIAPQKGIAFAQRLMESNGYANMINLVATAMQRDCPFFFQAD